MAENVNHNTKGPDKNKILNERNDKSKAFREDWDKQLERDQVVMPVDDLPLEDIEMENKEEEKKHERKHNSSSERI